MKIRETISCDLDLNKYYSGHDQHSRDFSRRLDTLHNANVGTVTFKPYNSQST